jgi:diguanylate cyclase
VRVSGNTIEVLGRAVETLAETNARLLRKVAQLECEVAQAHHLAYHDSLTGLPNRALLLDRLNQAMLQATRQQKVVGLLLLDLDGFKTVNDRFGHNVGDLLLQQVATRLLGCIRGCDTACRYGGDEFVIMLPEAGGAEDTEAVKQKLRTRLSVPYRLGEYVVAIGASIGAAVFKAGTVSCVELIDAADSAMYRAKAHSVATARRRYAINGNRDYQDEHQESQPRLTIRPATWSGGGAAPGADRA